MQEGQTSSAQPMLRNFPLFGPRDRAGAHSAYPRLIPSIIAFRKHFFKAGPLVVRWEHAAPAAPMRWEIGNG
jgi:hypothetical protein